MISMSSLLGKVVRNNFAFFKGMTKMNSSLFLKQFLNVLHGGCIVMPNICRSLNQMDHQHRVWISSAMCNGSKIKLLSGELERSSKNGDRVEHTDRVWCQLCRTRKWIILEESKNDIHYTKWRMWWSKSINLSLP